MRQALSAICACEAETIVSRTGTPIKDLMCRCPCCDKILTLRPVAQQAVIDLDQAEPTTPSELSPATVNVKTGGKKLVTPISIHAQEGTWAIRVGNDYDTDYYAEGSTLDAAIAGLVYDVSLEAVCDEARAWANANL